MGTTHSFAGDTRVDCYFHKAVPSVAVCRDCQKTICATCRDAQGLCPGCRLDQRIKSAQSARAGLSGQVGPSVPPPPQPNRAPQPQPQARTTALAVVSPETRALLAFGYPLWPLAAVALLDPKRTPEVRRQALQSLAFNFGSYALITALGFIAHIPVLGWSAYPLFVIGFPVWLVLSVIYGVKVWHGDEVRIPIVSDWLDVREARAQETARAR
jgi:uncharacterized membrane protein